MLHRNFTLRWELSLIQTSFSIIIKFSSFIFRQLKYPTCPDVKMKKLPFYDVQATLLKPTSLQPTGQAKFQQQNFSFHLTPQQAEMIQQSGYRDSMGRPDFKKQVLVRFSLLETSCEQEDNFPLSLCVKVCKERKLTIFLQFYILQYFLF